MSQGRKVPNTLTETDFTVAWRVASLTLDTLRSTQEATQRDDREDVLAIALTYCAWAKAERSPNEVVVRQVVEALAKSRAEPFHPERQPLAVKVAASGQKTATGTILELAEDSLGPHRTFYGVEKLWKTI